MAATIANRVNNHVVGDVRVTVSDIGLDASYPTGGYPLTPAQLGLNSVSWSFSQVKLDGGAGAVTACWYDNVNKLLLCYTASGQVANATDLSADTIQLSAYGY